MWKYVYILISTQIYLIYVNHLRLCFVHYSENASNACHKSPMEELVKVEINVSDNIIQRVVPLEFHIFFVHCKQAVKIFLSWPIHSYYIGTTVNMLLICCMIDLSTTFQNLKYINSWHSGGGVWVYVIVFYFNHTYTYMTVRVGGNS